MPAVATALTIAAVAAAPAPAPSDAPPSACATGNAPSYACEAELRHLAGASPLAVPAQTAIVRRSRTAIEVRCYAQPGAGCHGTIELRVLVPAPVLGVARVDLDAGARAEIRLTVRPRARRIAAAAGVGAFDAPAVARFRADGAPAPVTAGAVALQ